MQLSRDCVSKDSHYYISSFILWFKALPQLTRYSHTHIRAHTPSKGGDQRESEGHGRVEGEVRERGGNPAEDTRRRRRNRKSNRTKLKIADKE